MKFKIPHGIGDKGVAVVTTALSVLMIIFLTYIISRYALFFVIDCKYRRMMQETLRVAQGIPNLWIYNPKNALERNKYRDAHIELYENFLKIANHQRIDVSGPTVHSVSNSNAFAPSGTPVQMAFLPPGECADVAGQRICNSLVCSEAGAGRCEMNTPPSMSYQDLLRNYPTEVVFCYNPQVVGVGKRCVRSIGYPRLSQSQAVGAVIPTYVSVGGTTTTTISDDCIFAVGYRNTPEFAGVTISEPDRGLPSCLKSFLGTKYCHSQTANNTIDPSASYTVPMPSDTASPTDYLGDENNYETWWLCYLHNLQTVMDCQATCNDSYSTGAEKLECHNVTPECFPVIVADVASLVNQSPPAGLPPECLDRLMYPSEYSACAAMWYVDNNCNPPTDITGRPICGKLLIASGF